MSRVRIPSKHQTPLNHSKFNNPHRRQSSNKKDPWIPVSGLGSDIKFRNKWNRSFLNDFQKTGDPFGDEAAMELVKNNQQQWYRTFMQSQIKNADTMEEYPSVLRNFVAKTTTLPSFADKEKIRHGLSIRLPFNNVASQLFWRYAYAISSSLNWASLPMTYSVPEGAIVLDRTGEIGKKTKPRILRTSQYILHLEIYSRIRLVTSVHSAQGFEPRGYAAVNIAKVRLTHAFVRYGLTKNETNPWNYDLYGAPVNQRDQVGTLMVFSGVIVDCLERLGATLTQQEKEAMIHLWQVVGVMHGIDAKLIPESLEDMFGLGRAICREYSRKDALGISLTKSLVEFLKEVTPGKMGDGIHEIMMRHLLGDELADMVEVSSYPSYAPMVLKMITGIMRRIDRLGDESETAAKSLGVLRKINMNIALFVMNQGKRRDFMLADSMLRDLGMMKKEYN